MIAVTGATGPFGRAVVESMLERGVSPAEIVAVVRDESKAAGLRESGVQVRVASYDDPTALTRALQGVDRLLLVSGNEVGQRVRQHGNVIAAAKAAGVRRLAYTSVLNAGTTGIRLADEHKATEALIRASGIPFILLRNGWYLENYTPQIGSYLARGIVAGSAGEGRLSAATRTDLAGAAAAALLEDESGDVVYELGGEPAFTLAELAAEVSAASGRPVRYQDMAQEEYAQLLVGAGLPEPYAAILADSDRGIRRGELYTDSGHLRRLLGRAPVTLRQVIADAVAALPRA